MRTLARGLGWSRVTPSRHGAAAAAAPDQGGEARLDLSGGSARRHDARVTGLAMGSAVEPSAGHWPESPRTARQTSA